MLVTDRERAGNTTITDPRSQRIRASRRGGQITTSNSRFMSVRRPARTCVLPVPRYPDQPSILSPAIPADRDTKASMPDNAFAEAFNGRVRAECLNAHWFLTLADAREKLEAWRKCYNEDRPHGAIRQRPPVSLQNPGGITSPPP